jgi:hydrogenase maturation protease
VSRLLIIGYGNPLRGDDGFGYQAAERLRDLIHDPDIEILAVHQLTPELMDPLSRAGQAIFLDATTGPTPGEVQERIVEPDPAAARNFTHHFTPETLVASARALFGRAAPSTLITCAGTQFDCSYVLSQPVQISLDRTVIAVLRRM